MQLGIDKAQDDLMPFPGVPQRLADGEVREALAQVLEARQGEQVVVMVGGCERARSGPEGEEAVVHDIEGFGLVPEVVFAAGSGSLSGILGCIGIGTWL